jgi:ATP-dependent DNA helicase RecQ
MSESTRRTLTEVFGFKSFRGEQEAVVDHLVEGGSAFCLMPTGAGKSLCYQIPSLIRSGFGLVVSPLQALMDNQVAAMRQLGIRAHAFHSGLNVTQARQAPS